MRLFPLVSLLVAVQRRSPAHLLQAENFALSRNPRLHGGLRSVHPPPLRFWVSRSAFLAGGC